MKRNAREAADRRLAELYAKVPEMDCKGLCHTSCGIIECSTREHELIRQHGGVRIPTMMEFIKRDRAGEIITCPALTQDRRCSVYEVRPMICRLWGASVAMPCPYGCEPKDGELLDEGETFELLAGSMAAGGGEDWANSITGPSVREFARKNPGLTAELLRRGQVGDQRRADEQRRQIREQRRG